MISDGYNIRIAYSDSLDQDSNGDKWCGGDRISLMDLPAGWAAGNGIEWNVPLICATRMRGNGRISDQPQRKFVRMAGNTKESGNLEDQQD